MTCALSAAVLLGLTVAGVPAGAEGGSTRWTAEHGEGTPAYSSDVVVSPDGSTVFVTGASDFGASGRIITLAYDARTGAERWTATLPGRVAAESGRGRALAVSPDGRSLFVTGGTYCLDDRRCGGAPEDAWATVAYDAATGRQRWVERLATGGGGGSEQIEVSRDGSRLLVHGQTEGGRGSATVAYDPASGRQFWVARKEAGLGYSGGGMSLSADGRTVYVGDTESFEASDCFIAGGLRASAYDVASGVERWTTRHTIPVGDHCGTTTDLGVSADGSTVFLTGYGGGDGEGGYAVTTLALAAATGEQRWVRTDDEMRVLDGDTRISLVVHPRRSRVLISGYRCGDEQCAGAVAATTSYDGATGEIDWRSEYDGGGRFYAADLAISADGRNVFLTGQESAPCLAGCHTAAVSAPVVAYDVRTGRQEWAISHPDQVGHALAAAPGGDSVFLAGTLTGSTATARTAWAARPAKRCVRGSYCGSTTARIDGRPGVGTFHETGPAVRFDGWRSVFATQALGGAYRASRTPGDAVTFRTPRTSSFSWVTREGASMGRARVTIDGRRAKVVDLRAKRAGGPRTVRFDGLAARPHEVRIEVLAPKRRSGRGGWVALDAFRYPVGNGLAQESAPSVAYGAWASARGPGGGSVRVSSSASSRLGFEFRGRTLRWATVVGRTSGRARVLVDGRARVVDLYRPTAARRAVISFTGLGRGSHRVLISPLGRSAPGARSADVAVDAFVVRG